MTRELLGEKEQNTFFSTNKHEGHSLQPHYESDSAMS